ncbi:hypothetical protein B296_00004294 [Ensete ventricosum]|uniref:Uncharacterized protein n=1 Tax=Ensete ventricosum TaxID=4639 RepID=A0A426ZJA0_ENSVE|nr:hypothetical protein B296_00004294 [Ensete ventricosum]
MTIVRVGKKGRRRGQRLLLLHVFSGGDTSSIGSGRGGFGRTMLARRGKRRHLQWRHKGRTTATGRVVVAEVGDGSTGQRKKGGWSRYVSGGCGRGVGSWEQQATIGVEK